MKLPDFLEPVRKQGYELYKKHEIGEITFSGPTYQVEVFDEETQGSVWVFLQLEDSSVKDIFCSCDISTDKGVCPHMAAGCFSLFNTSIVPMHARFERSFWHALFFAMSEKCTTALPVVKKTKTGFDVSTADGQLLFSAAFSFVTFIDKKTQETEETSIKFSNLSDDELERWRSGRPSPKLRYELSIFSDIAKWLFLQKEVVVTFQGLKAVEITSGEQKLYVPLTQEDLFPLIPRLSTISSSLQLFTGDICDVQWEQKTKQMVVTKRVQPPENGQSVGDWIYLPDVGFWPKEAEITKEVLSDNESLQALFTTHLDLLKKKLPDVSFESIPQPLEYRLFFDSSKSLHIQSYISEVGDLDAPSFLFGTWAYSSKVGFVAIQATPFTEPHLVVPREELSSFILAHRAWLSQFPGFAVHVAKLEEEIVYEVDAQANVCFRSILQKLPKARKRIDLGSWVYVVDDGFYMQHFTETVPLLPLGEPIFRYSVADFIRHHQDILHAVPHFFATSCPVKEVGIQVNLKSRGIIEILPEYAWHDENDKNFAIFYDEFIFVPKKGFYRLPASLRPLHFARTIRQDDPEAWGSFFSESLPRLEKEYVCHIDPRLKKCENLLLTVAPQADESEGGDPKALSDWDLDIYWKSMQSKVTLDTLIQAKKQKVRYMPTDAGLIDLSEERFHWLEQFQERKAIRKNGKKGRIRLESSDFLRLSSYDTIHVETTLESTKKGFDSVLQKLLALSPPEPPELSTLNCELRPYQTNGVSWLWYLYSYRLSGLLCDDMGVGKTHQAMGLVDAITTANRKIGKKSLFLVICPTSLVYHWQDKIERFLPGFRVKTYVSTDRSLDDFPEEFDLLLTSYGIWRNEAAKMKKYHFDAAFFDELQIAKNHVSQIHAALLLVQSDMKLGLTGTPIENQLRELKAIFDIVLPGYMPKESDFREFFVRPIERLENSERKKLLSRYVRPFVLRRRKVDVLPDLPEKSEELCVTELLGEQKSLYRHVASHQARPLIQQLRDEGSPIPYMHIFQLLSSLKQICNHPATYLKDTENFERYESGKWEAFLELLEEAMESEQKVVVFSQYLSMLDIIEVYLKKSNIGYAQIRGQTKNRGNEVGRFQEDPNCKVFLGSLQAAGLGIDLTSASVVIHYDRWWNAARENQATDRVHRIGQVRGVQVFKMVTKGSVEESIDQMIIKKSGLLEDVVFFDDHQIVKKLTRNEIISLLENLSEE